jgi:hypothetical protein
MRKYGKVGSNPIFPFKKGEVGILLFLFSVQGLFSSTFAM